jgi:ribosomal protein S18 acetylase RimI-like enzyme
MNDLTAYNYTSTDLTSLAGFLDKVRKAYPDAKLNSPEFYTYHPALDEGRNAFCVSHAGQPIVGFAPLFPVPAAESEPHHIWTILLADPDDLDATSIRDLLFEQVLARAAALKSGFPPGPVRLAADMMVSQRPDIDYLLSRGFQAYEKIHVMQRSALDPIPAAPLPAGLAVRTGKLASEADQLAYLHAFNTCFPDMPKTLETLHFVLESPLWMDGLAVAAVTARGELAGSVLVYVGEDKAFGLIDDVFVLPAWRGQGVAKSLIGQGLAYLRAQGVADVRLEVKASNGPAVVVYQAMGYRIVNEEVLLGMFI